MPRPHHLVIATGLLSVNVSAMGEPLSYVCEVAHVYNLSNQGTLEISVWEKDMKGSSFAVSRLTGEVIGNVIPTLMAKSTRVVNFGSKDYSFKSVADFGINYQVLEIQEFVEGPIKPFVSSSMGGAGIVTGLCQ